MKIDGKKLTIALLVTFFLKAKAYDKTCLKACFICFLCFVTINQIISNKSIFIPTKHEGPIFIPELFNGNKHSSYPLPSVHRSNSCNKHN